MNYMKKYNFPGVLLIVLFGLLFIMPSCGGGGGGGGGVATIPAASPFIYAELISIPTGSSLPGYQSASVYVLDNNTGSPIMTAIVTINGVTLSYISTDGDYEGDVVVVPGGSVVLNVTVAGSTYTASGTQFTSYPTIDEPTPGATWTPGAPHSIKWSGNYPTTNTFIGLGVLDADNSSGRLLWPSDGYILELLSSESSYTIPAGSLTSGNDLILVVIGQEIPISSTAPGSSLVIGGFTYAPITIGNLDTAFSGAGKVTTDIGGNADEAHAVAIQGDGKIVAVGYSYNGTKDDFALVRYNTDGSLDTTFGTSGTVTTAIGSGDDRAYAVAIQSDGKIVAVGYSYNGTKDDFALVRYNTDGSLDTTFGTYGIVTTAIGSGDDRAYAVAIQGDGKIVAAGVKSDYPGFSTPTLFALVRYNTNGSLDTTFGGTGMVTTSVGSFGGDAASAVAIHSDGKIVVAGHSRGEWGSVFALARFNVDGSLDSTFGGTGIVTTSFAPWGIDYDAFAYAVAIQGDGKIVTAGYRYGFNYIFRNTIALVRYNSDGSLDTAFGTYGTVSTAIGNGDNKAYAVVIQGDGKITAAGYSYNGTNDDFALVRYNANGSLDTTFGTYGTVTTAIGSGDDRAYAVAIQSDGKIVAAGYSYNGTNNDFALVRYLQ